MKSIDASKKHQVSLIFLLDEEVTPQLYVQKIALACGFGGVLRPGEGILIPHAKIACVVTDAKTAGPFITHGLVAELLGPPSFGYQWRSSLKKIKRPKKKATRPKEEG